MYEIPLDIRIFFRRMKTITEIALETFPEWFNGKIKGFRGWYNNSRFHSGIGDIPARIYVYT